MKKAKGSFKLNSQDWEDFKNNADKELGLDASKVLRMFVKKFNENPKEIYKSLI